MQKHVHTLGVLFLVYGLIGVVAMLVVFAIFRLSFDPVHVHHFHGLYLTHIIGLLIIGIIAFFHLPALVVGWGLVQRCSWARIPGLVVGVIILPLLPFGTALGVYALWVLLKEETAQYLSGTQRYRAG